MPPRMKISRKALGDIARSEAVELVLFGIAEEMKNLADPSGHLGEDAYVAVSSTTRKRARASVIAASAYAVNSNAKHNTLIGVLGSYRYRGRR